MSTVGITTQVESYALSHPGRRRSNNEDAYLIDRQLGLYIVCDGMGGHAAGEVASSMAVDIVHASLKKIVTTKPPRVDTFEGRQLLRKQIAQAVFEAGQRIFQAGKSNPKQKGMGTTITLCLLISNKAFIGHVGDSRCYLLRNQRTHQLTEDHTFFNEVKKTSGLEAAQKAVQRIPNALSRALGAQPAVQVDTLELDLFPGDKIILCSDGLSGYLDDNNVDIQAFQTDTPLAELPQKFVHFANQMGGKDNITVAVLQVAAQGGKDANKIRSSMAALRHLQLFQQLDYTEHIQLFNAFTMQEYPSGEVLIHEGAQGDALFVLVQGNVRVMRNGQMMARLEPGNHFGEMALVDNSPRSATVVAEGACLLLRMSRADFDKLIQQKPVLGVRLMRNLLRSLASIVRDQSQEILRLSRGGNVHSPPPTMPPRQRPLDPANRGNASPSPLPTHRSRPPSAPKQPSQDDLSWNEFGELILPTEGVSEVPTRPGMKAAAPFAETAELKPFQPNHPVPGGQTAVPAPSDPFAETAELSAYRTAEMRTVKGREINLQSPRKRNEPTSKKK